MKKSVVTKICILCAALVISIATTGCEQTQKTSSSNDPGSKTADFSTVSLHLIGGPPENGTLEQTSAEWNKILKEKINTHLELKWIAWNEYMTKYNLLLASGDAADLVTASSTWLGMWENVAKGGFKDITDLLPEYAPATWSTISPEHWKECEYNGKIYCVPENKFSQSVIHGFFYRGDWAKEAGIEQPLQSFEDVEKYLDAIKVAKPDIYPYDTAARGDRAMLDFYVMDNSDALQIIGLPMFMAKSYDEPYTIYDSLFDDDMAIDYAKMMKRWAEKGFWRNDVLSYKGNVTDSMLAGKTALDQHHVNMFTGRRKEMDEKQPGSDYQMFVFGEKRGNLTAEPITHAAVTVAAASKQPERALMVYDLIRNDEQLYKLLNYGIEGKQYIVKDGMRSTPEGYDDLKDSYGISFWCGRMDQFEIPSDKDWVGAKDFLQKYIEKSRANLYGRFVFDKKAVSAEFTNVSELLNREVPAISAGMVDDPQGFVENLRTKLKQAGYDRLREEAQKQLDEYKKLVINSN